jgi:hypothetical protein
MLTFNDVATNPVHARILSGRSTAIGGAGGSGGMYTGANGGAGTASIALRGAGYVTATANATGGAGGSGGAGGAGGAAGATSTAFSTGAGTAVTAIATGGVGTTMGVANASASARAASGQQADADAVATGSSGSAQTVATTVGTSFVTGLSADAKSPVTSAGANARSLADASTVYGFNGATNDDYASGTIAPSAATVSNDFTTHSKVAAALGGAFSTVFAAGVQGAAYATGATGSLDYVSSQNFTLNGTIMSGHLIVGLLDDQALGTGFQSLTFTVLVGGVTKVTQTFSTVAAAQTYFTNNSVDAGAFSSKAGLVVTVKLDMTENAAGQGFGQDFLIGVTDAHPPPILSAPASQLVQQGQATAIGGVSVSEANALPSGQTVTVTLADTSGLLTVTPNGAMVTGSGTTNLSVTGTVAQVDAALASLTDRDSTFASDTITINSTDTRTGDAAPVTIAVSVNAPPIITVGGAQNVSEGRTAKIPGVSVADADAAAVHETLTVTVADTVGLLTATGTGVTGSGTKSLTITGSLTLVNADLATLKDTEGSIGTDQITINANDGRGGVAASQTINLAVSGPPVLAAPTTAVLGQGRPKAITGVSISESGATSGEAFTVVLTDTDGLLSATGTGITGSGTHKLTVTGPLSQANADLATLMDSEASAGSDSIRLTATDGNGGGPVTAAIGVTTNGLPTIAAPAAVVESQGVTKAIAGVSIGESGNKAGETFRTTLTDASGLLTATGTGVTGSGTQSLTITGSMSQVNADLATLKISEAAAGADTIILNTTDSLGNHSAQGSIAVTTAGKPMITAPASEVVGQGHSRAISGVRLSESGTVSGETFTITLSDASGLLSATGGGVTGSGTKSLKVVGSLSLVNSDLATLADIESTAGSDHIRINATDSVGGAAAQVSIALTINGLPAITAPASATVHKGTATAISGVSISETGNTTGETFTTTLTDTNGLLSATGAGVTGAGTKSLKITGSLSQVNSDLTTLTDNDPILASDTIHIATTDGLGNAAKLTSIAITVSSTSHTPGAPGETALPSVGLSVGPALFNQFAASHFDHAPAAATSLPSHVQQAERMIVAPRLAQV